MPSADRKSTAGRPRAKSSAKAVGQVMAALKNSKNSAGPTMNDIIKYITTALYKPATKRQVCTALKRGIEFGILKRKQGHYLISSPEEDFEKLSSPPKKIMRSGPRSKVDKVKKRRVSVKARTRQIRET